MWNFDHLKAKPRSEENDHPTQEEMYERQQVILRRDRPGMKGTQVLHHDFHPLTSLQVEDTRLIWDYHQMKHEPRPCSVAIGLGSHDLGVATAAADLYVAGLFPLLVFSGGNSPTTRERFPRGEAVHYREHALQRGVPDDAILVESRAENTGQNIAFSRDLLHSRGIEATSVMLISKPYMQRRSYATARKVWPEIDVVCASEDLTWEGYLRSIGDEKLVVDMLVGDLQRIIEYPPRGFAVEQDVPQEVIDAFDRLVRDGFDSRLIG
jgi:uncharacterized SAM-binding protein YcdF (DUF218 family)